VTEAPSRHLTPAALLEHWNSGVAVVIPLAGVPELRLRIDSPRESLTLRAPIDASTVSIRNELSHVRVELVAEGAQRFVEISTRDERLLLDGYAMLAAVADRIQIDGIEPLKALDETLSTWRSILAARVRMDISDEIGLFGELLVLEAVLASGQLDASAWRGGLREEHDFGFQAVDVEIKTTSGERRQHWINGLGQLVPTGETALWLLSVQITRGGMGQGRLLPVLVETVRLAAPTNEVRTHIDRVLAAAGWRDEQSDLFGDAWRIRSGPLALCVDSSFPRITPAQLAAGGVDVAAIRQVSYGIDVTDRLPSPDPPAPVAVMLEQMEAQLG